MSLNIREVFFFDEMLTPKLITLIYWLLLFAAVISGLGIMFSGMSFTGFIGGLVTIILGAVFARIWCELLIVIFKIHENLKRLADK
jgi:hypothetical protein